MQNISVFQWYYIDRGNTVGPVPTADLTQYLCAHGLNVFVWRDGQKDWLRASDVPELSSLRKTPPPPPTSAPITDAPVPFSPNLPDVTSVTASRAFRSNSYIALFVKDSKPLSFQRGAASAVSYPYVIVIVKDKVGPIYYIALETTIFGTKAIGVFDATGIHQNLGCDDSLSDERAFIDWAMAFAQDKFEEHFHEFPRPEAKTTWDWRATVLEATLWAVFLSGIWWLVKEKYWLGHILLWLVTSASIFSVGAWLKGKQIATSHIAISWAVLAFCAYRILI